MGGTWMRWESHDSSTPSGVASQQIPPCSLPGFDNACVMVKTNRLLGAAPPPLDVHARLTLINMC